VAARRDLTPRNTLFVDRDQMTELPPQALAEMHARMDEFLSAGPRVRFPHSMFRWPTDADATQESTVDWIAFPERIAACLGRVSALRVLDVEDRRIGDGGRRIQEEYAEWRLVRSERGIERVDFTVETSDYWRLLAAFAPHRALEVVGGFAEEPDVDVSLVYGPIDPFASETTPGMRESAFAQTMLEGGTSAYNDGSRAITCMVHPGNSIPALLELAVAATSSLAVLDPERAQRSPTCVELARSIGSAAQLGRASDPLVVERLARLAFEGRRVALDTPGPLAISGVEHARLRTPSGQPVPAEWFRFSRPMRPEGRYQRLSLSVPGDEDFCVSDLIDVATEDAVTTGGQVADLVQLSLYLRATEPVGEGPEQLDVHGEPELVTCADVRAAAADLEPQVRRE
jgi:hypothetical protein